MKDIMNVLRSATLVWRVKRDHYQGSAIHSRWLLMQLAQVTNWSLLVAR